MKEEIIEAIRGYNKEKKILEIALSMTNMTWKSYEYRERMREIDEAITDLLSTPKDTAK